MNLSLLHRLDQEVSQADQRRHAERFDQGVEFCPCVPCTKADCAHVYTLDSAIEATARAALAVEGLARVLSLATLPKHVSEQEVMLRRLFDMMTGRTLTHLREQKFLYAAKKLEELYTTMLKEIRG